MLIPFLLGLSIASALRDIDEGRIAGVQASKGIRKSGPLLTAFDGQQFVFAGRPGRCYNLLSRRSTFQVTTCLRQAPGSNRVYMKGVAFKEGPIRVVVETRDDFQQEMTVVVNDELQTIPLPEIEPVLQKSFLLENGKGIQLQYSLYDPDLGPFVSISTDEFKLVVTQGFSGPNEFGWVPPPYLNINVSMVVPRHDRLMGALGNTYFPQGRPAASMEYPVYAEGAYEVSDYFGRPGRELIADLFTNVFPSKSLRQGLKTARHSWESIRRRAHF
eukprot:jgi/Botrbrau1/1543/Bobra.0107s0031.1